MTAIDPLAMAKMTRADPAAVRNQRPASIGKCEPWVRVMRLAWLTPVDRPMTGGKPSGGACRFLANGLCFDAGDCVISGAMGVPCRDGANVA